MAKGMWSGDRRQRMIWDLENALEASRDLRTVLTDAYPLILSLVGADYCALAATLLESSTELEWFPYNMPPAFFGSYPRLAQHDFVLNAVLPNVHRVMRDDEMLKRRDLERHVMYRWAREVDAPIEQVMAIMLHAADGLHSGLAFYRAARRPFSSRDRRTLQELAPLIAIAVRQCRRFENMAPRSAVLDKLLGSERGVIIVRFPSREVARTQAATALLDAWFSPVERGVGGLPIALLEELAAVRAAMKRGNVQRRPWERPGIKADLKVKFLPLPEPVDEPFWALVLRVAPHDPPLPAAWKGLTKAERAVAQGMLLGLDDRGIADERDSKLSTVKSQVRRVFEKVGVDDRKKLSNLYRMLMDD